MSELQFVTKSVAQTVAVGRAVSHVLNAGDVVALSGELGAGKTQLVRGIAIGRGADGRVVSSPTFVLMQEYEAEPTVVHIDAYRIDSLDDLESMGWDEPAQQGSVNVIEWADRIASELPDDRVAIDIEHLGDEKRRLTLGLLGTLDEREDRLRAALLEHADIGLNCPICQSPVLDSDGTFPFCSKRCKTIDLGRWLGGDYKITREVDWENDDLAAMEQDTDSEP